MKIIKKISLFLLLLILIGCSPLEIARVMGVGTKPFRAEGEIYSKTFDKDYFTCYENIYSGLKGLGAHFYRGSRKQGFIVATHFNSVFAQSSESTEVAVFFQEISSTKTRVEISSLNHELSQFLAVKLLNLPQN